MPLFANFCYGQLRAKGVSSGPPTQSLGRGSGVKPRARNCAIDSWRGAPTPAQDVKHAISRLLPRWLRDCVRWLPIGGPSEARLLGTLQTMHHPHSPELCCCSALTQINPYRYRAMKPHLRPVIGAIGNRSIKIWLGIKKVAGGGGSSHPQRGAMSRSPSA